MSSFKQKLRKQELTLGSWLTFPCEATTEIMCRAGFEWLVIDMEHAPLGVQEASRLIRIIDLTGVPALCRLPSNDPHVAKTILDAGAAGIIVPMIESPEQAQQAVKAAHYPPQGKRGVGLGRAHAYGDDFEGYRSKSAESLIVIAMIETAAGVENVEAIASTPGIDGLLIGPYDLSASLGLIGQLEHPDLLTSKVRVLNAARKSGIGCGLHVVHPEQKTIKDALKFGYSFLALGVDMIFLSQAAGDALKGASKEK